MIKLQSVLQCLVHSFFKFFFSFKFLPVALLAPAAPAPAAAVAPK
ncbi:MAG: hypothetical protein ACI90V_001496 [Bacillariaceae sp.]|jgi:hypothetical protein